MSAPVEVAISGAEQLVKLGRDLKAAGSPAIGLRRDLLAALRLAGKPLKDAAVKSAKANLPHKGHLDDFVVNSNYSIRNQLSGRAVGVRIRAAKGHHYLERMDDGKLRHPVFGNRKGKWVNQTIKGGWWSKPLEAGAPAVQVELLIVIEATRDRLAIGAY